jgi:hypothetical protein
MIFDELMNAPEDSQLTRGRERVASGSSRMEAVATEAMEHQGEK